MTALAVLTLPDRRTLLASASHDETVRLWDPSTRHPVGQPLTGHTSPVTALAVLTLPDGGLFQDRLCSTFGGDGAWSLSGLDPKGP
ncbi:hypothetical protein MXD62_24295 [Frankia sp. Mgl5]|uniref:hypothetical protein n=1 Tax=Frankia sp. Mgl5 TaxID=2933793 RepID=UPI00200CEC41|nr:hypothetical protein [Frankia sp. Mgl5]MCK9930250.1 hypothetical protein [Frankia sp. Mgl5]